MRALGLSRGQRVCAWNQSVCAQETAAGPKRSRTRLSAYAPETAARPKCSRTRLSVCAPETGAGAKCLRTGGSLDGKGIHLQELCAQDTTARPKCPHARPRCVHGRQLLEQHVRAGRGSNEDRCRTDETDVRPKFLRTEDNREGKYIYAGDRRKTKVSVHQRQSRGQGVFVPGQAQNQRVYLRKLVHQGSHGNKAPIRRNLCTGYSREGKVCTRRNLCTATAERSKCDVRGQVVCTKDSRGDRVCAQKETNTRPKCRRGQSATRMDLCTGDWH